MREIRSERDVRVRVRGVCEGEGYNEMCVREVHVRRARGFVRLHHMRDRVSSTYACACVCVCGFCVCSVHTYVCAHTYVRTYM